MATQRVNYASQVYVPVFACQEVYLCLDSSWAAQTQDGLTLIKATVANSGRYLGSGGNPFSPRFENPRGEGEYQYSFEVDDSQFLVDGGTGNPYILDCSDILEVIPYSCAIESLIAAIGGDTGQTLQAGTIAHGGFDTTDTEAIVFPNAFTAPPVVMVSVDDDGAGGEIGVNVETGSVTVNGFSVSLNSGGVVPDGNVYWFAFGILA